MELLPGLCSQRREDLVRDVSGRSRNRSGCCGFFDMAASGFLNVSSDGFSGTTRSLSKFPVC
jgi:hypothetical protein